MPRLAALASAADNICFASSSVRLAYVRGMSPPFRHVLSHRYLRRLVGHSGVFDPDRLRVHKRMKPEMREFSTVPAVLDAADRHARIGSGDAVDEQSARIQITCDPAGQFNIPGPEIAAQPELACIRRFDCCIDVPYPGDCGNRPEGLLIECGHALGHSAQDSRRVKGALAGHWLPAAQYARSLCDAAFHLFM